VAADAGSRAGDRIPSKSTDTLFGDVEVRRAETRRLGLGLLIVSDACRRPLRLPNWRCQLLTDGRSGVAITALSLGLQPGVQLVFQSAQDTRTESHSDLFAAPLFQGFNR
jgi:hypothetical protein